MSANFDFVTLVMFMENVVKSSQNAIDEFLHDEKHPKESSIIHGLRCAQDAAKSWLRNPELQEAALKLCGKRLDVSGWIRAEDALPVVPEGANSVNIWAWNTSLQVRAVYMPWKRTHAQFTSAVTHWRYAEPTPQPPEGSK